MLVERAARLGVDDAVGGGDVALGLERLHRFDERIVIDVGGAVGRGNAEPLAHERYVLVRRARIELVAFGRDVRRFACVAAIAAGEVLLAQLLELRMLRMHLLQVFARGGAGGDLVHDEKRMPQCRLAIEVGAELRRRILDAAAAGIARVLERGERQRHLGVGQRLLRLGGVRHQRGQRRHLEVGGIQAPVVGTFEFVDDRQRLRRPTLLIDPHRLGPRGVEHPKAVAVGLASCPRGAARAACAAPRAAAADARP